MTKDELEKFKESARDNYLKVNEHIKHKCTDDFSAFLMRSILPEDDGVCRKCVKWLTDLCYTQGMKEKTCVKFLPIKRKEAPNEPNNT